MNLRNFITQIRNYADEVSVVVKKTRTSDIKPNIIKRSVDPRFSDSKPYPEYPLMNIRLQGYDYFPLEIFQRYVKKLTRMMGFKHIEKLALFFP